MTFKEKIAAKYQVLGGGGAENDPLLKDLFASLLSVFDSWIESAEDLLRGATKSKIAGKLSMPHLPSKIGGAKYKRLLEGARIELQSFRKYMSLFHGELKGLPEDDVVAYLDKYLEIADTVSSKLRRVKEVAFELKKALDDLGGNIEDKLNSLDQDTLDLLASMEQTDIMAFLEKTSKLLHH